MPDKCFLKSTTTTYTDVTQLSAASVHAPDFNQHWIGACNRMLPLNRTVGFSRTKRVSDPCRNCNHY